MSNIDEMVEEDKSDLIEIDGEIYTVYEVHDYGYIELETDGGDFIVFADSSDAGNHARERWEDMANNDPKEFTCIIGEERLVKWALGQSDEYGFSSLEDFLDAIESHPEEELASYDFVERDVTDCSPELVEEIGFTPKLAYRNN